jgi:protein-tyrosine-phosphatase
MSASLGPQPQAILFVCGHNVIRSPMAAALANHLFGRTIYVKSAGVRKTDPDPFVTAVMDEIGIDMARHRPVTLEELEDEEGFNFDLVVTLAPDAHHAALDLTHRLPFDVEYWPIANPVGTAGNREQMLDAYRAVRDDLLGRIKVRFAWRRIGAD